MRRLLNILAVMVGMLSLLIILSNAVLFVLAMNHYVRSGAKPPADLPTLAIIGLGAGLCFIGLLIGSRAVGHLRRPDARSASDVLTIAIYMLVLTGVFPLIKSVPYIVILVLIGLFFIRRYVIKQSARIFPPEGTASHA